MNSVHDVQRLAERRSVPTDGGRNQSRAIACDWWNLLAAKKHKESQKGNYEKVATHFCVFLRFLRPSFCWSAARQLFSIGRLTKLSGPPIRRVRWRFPE